MSLFKKKKEQAVPQCACNGNCSTSEVIDVTKDCCSETEKGISNIKVLGAGCKTCHEQYDYAKTAVKNLGIDIEVEYITDLQKVMTYGVMSMPALVVNDKVVCMGKVLKTSEVEKLLSEYK